MTNFIPDSKPYPVTLNSENECLSVRCDFYQTCNKNRVSKFYKTKHKFDPVIECNLCYSFHSGKDSKFNDNCYPKSLSQFF